MYDNAAAIILAGGKCARMEEDKGLLEIQGRSMIRYIYEKLTDLFPAVWVNTDREDRYPEFRDKLIIDMIPGHGPLMGILSAVRATGHDLNFVLACDMPVVDQGLIKTMLGMAVENDIVVPRHGDDLLEPLCAVYRKSIVRPARQLLDTGERKVRKLFSLVKTAYCPVKNTDWLRNINTKEDYLSFRKELENR